MLGVLKKSLEIVSESLGVCHHLSKKAGIAMWSCRKMEVTKLNLRPPALDLAGVEVQ